MNRYLFNYDFFQDIDNEHKAYWLGFFVCRWLYIGYEIEKRKENPANSANLYIRK